MPSDGTLVFSYVGFKAVEVAIAGRTRIDVTMHEDSEILDEVVVVGYGSLSRKELSSSIVQVNSADFGKGAMNSPMEMLTGKVAGLNVSSTASANPNAGADLQVRGATSLSAGNGPLIVIDGVAGGDIRTSHRRTSSRCPSQRDAASAAIYGTRGANGVILITTKKGTGEAGKPVITFDTLRRPGIRQDKPEVLSPTNGASPAAATTTAQAPTGTTSSHATRPTTPTSTSPSTARLKTADTTPLRSTGRKPTASTSSAAARSSAVARLCRQAPSTTTSASRPPSTPAR